MQKLSYEKKILPLILLSLINCRNIDETLNTADEPSKSELHIKNPSQFNKSVSQSNILLTDVSFWGKNPSNGGCTFDEINYNGTGTYTSTAAFGSNPLPYKGYIIRGYGKPQTSPYISGLIMSAENRGARIINVQEETYRNDPLSNAVSIEFPFQANLTYEIILTTNIKDMRAVKSSPYFEQFGTNTKWSETYPTVALELKDSPEIQGSDPCAERPVVGMNFTGAPNYYKKIKYDIKFGPKTLTFNFSPTESKGAFLIYTLTEVTESFNSSYVPISDYAIYIQNIKIIQKPFDPSHFIPPPPRGNPCGSRNGVCP